MSDNPKIRRRLRCPNCGALDTLKWGVRNGVQRYKCRNCQSLFSARRKEIYVAVSMEFQLWMDRRAVNSFPSVEMPFLVDTAE